MYVKQSSLISGRWRGSELMLLVVVTGIVLSVGFGCSPDEEKVNTPPTPTPFDASRIEFPESLHSDDAEVNEFIRTAIMTCIGGDYEAFRLLWSTSEEPMARPEYDRGWQAVLRVRVDLLEKMQRAEGEIVYVLAGHVELDPDKVPDPGREFVLLLVEESGQWRVASAPRSVRKWAKQHREKSQTSVSTNGPAVNTSGVSQDSNKPDEDSATSASSH